MEAIPRKPNDGDIPAAADLHEEGIGAAIATQEASGQASLRRKLWELEQKAAELRRMEARLRELSLLVSKLVHELRNPLDGAMRFLNLSLSDHSPPECRQRYLLATKQGLERIHGIVEGFAALSGCGSANGEPVEVNELVRQAIALQEAKAQERNVRVELDLADGLPPVPGGGALFQVFTNLVSNALDAMEANGGTLAVSSWRENGSILVRVADTGHGMPPEVLQQLFRPFFTTKPPGKGMGLGLAVCREVLDRLRGQIHVSSTPGRGTVFLVTVPCDEAET